MSQNRPPPITARWLSLRRRILIAGFALAAVNTGLLYINVLGGRSRAALQIVSDLNTSYSQPTIRHARKCIKYILTFEEEKISKLWNDDTFSVTIPDEDEAKYVLYDCLSGFPENVQNSLPGLGPPPPTSYLRRQAFGYLNVHELAYYALATNIVDNYTLCKQSDLGSDPLIKSFINKLISNPNIGSHNFYTIFPALYSFMSKISVVMADGLLLFVITLASCYRPPLLAQCQISRKRRNNLARVETPGGGAAWPRYIRLDVLSEFRSRGIRFVKTGPMP